MSTPGFALKFATLAFLVTIWGTTWAAVRISLRGFPPLTGVALRFAIAAVILVMIIFEKLFGYAGIKLQLVDGLIQEFYPHLWGTNT